MVTRDEDDYEKVREIIRLEWEFRLSIAELAKEIELCRTSFQKAYSLASAGRSNREVLLILEKIKTIGNRSRLFKDQSNEFK